MGFFGNKSTKTGNRSSNMKVILEHSGTPLYEINLTEYSGEIVIGRSQSCTWTLDGIDTSASSKHAVISKRRNHFYITDLGSRNGIYFQNKRIKERKLALGDRISLGECTVVVEIMEEKNKLFSKFHRLEYLDAKGHRTVIDINKPQMVIGSSPDCDIIIQNQLISSQHAEFLLRNDGSCWIRDLNSRNGTSVNGMDLGMESERMLQDSDVINIAYLEMRFLDAAVEHQDSKIWTSVITLAVTILILMAGYIGYLRLTPDSQAYVDMAKIEMNAGNYKVAMDLLDSASSAEGSENTAYEREALIQKIKLWKNVIITWNAIQKDLANKKYLGATQKLASLRHDELNAWTWPRGYNKNEVGGIEKKKAAAIKRLLDVRSAARGLIFDEYASLEDVKSVRIRLVSALADVSEIKEKYTEHIHTEINVILNRIDEILSDDRDMKTALDLLLADSPNYDAIIKRLEKIRKESSGLVKARAEKILPPVRTLARETDRFLRIIDKVGEMEFDAVNNFQLVLPETIDWAIQKNIGVPKRKLTAQVEQFKDMALQLSLLYRTLVNKGVVTGKKLAILEDLQNDTAMDSLYQFDCLKYQVPKQRRKKPAGVYDELLGIEFFYDYISNLEGEQGSMIMLDELPFVPQIYKVRQVITDIEKFLQFAGKDENLWFKRKALAAYIKHCEDILKTRDVIIRKHLNRDYKAGTREFIVSRGISAYLSTDDKQRKMLANDVIKSFSSLKKRMAEEMKEYDGATPQERIKIAENILKIGIPGNKTLRIIWAERSQRGME